MTKTSATKVLSATAAHVTLTQSGFSSVRVSDKNTGQFIGQCDLVRGFAHYFGVTGSAHEGMKAVVRGGVDGLVRALKAGLVNGRDDRA